MADCIEESYYIQINTSDKLHIKRIYQNPLGIPVFMLHGAIENGKIFYSKSQKGLAPFLARAGYDVYIGDLRGRGESTPKITKHSCYGQTEAILEDLPAFINFIRERKPKQKQIWIAHSWGGVLITAFFARFPNYIAEVRSCAYFASKRSVRVWNLERLFKVDLAWKLLAPLLILIKGYLPAKELHIGSDNETKKSHQQSVVWVRQRKWVDTDDGFNYHEALNKLKLPATLYIAAKGDKSLGHPNDVQRLMAESGNHESDYVLLSVEQGHSQNYDHIAILTHPDAESEQFQLILDWIKKH